MRHHRSYHGNIEPNEPSNVSKAMELAGGFSVIGSVGAGVTVIAGEVAEAVLPFVDEFPGGAVAKAAGGLAIAAVALISGSELSK